MKCSKIRRLIADGGPAALADNQKAEDHLVECAACYAVLESMAEVDRLLPELEQLDAADSVVEQLLARPELSTRPGLRSAGTAARFSRMHPLQWLGGAIDRARQTRLRWGLVAVPAVLVVGLISVTTMRSKDVSEAPQKVDAVKQVKAIPSTIETGEVEYESSDDVEEIFGQAAGWIGETATDETGDGREGGQRMNRPIDATTVPAPRARKVVIPDPSPQEPEVRGETGATADDQAFAGYVVDENIVLGVPAAPPRPRTGLETDTFFDRAGRDIGTDSEEAGLTHTTETLNARADSDKDGLVLQTGHAQDHEQPLSENQTAKRELDEFRRNLDQLESQSTALRDLGDVKNADLLDAQLKELKKRLEEYEVVGGKVDSSSVSEPNRSHQVEVDEDALATARSFLAERNRVEGLNFREARGYWANTYVPGDRTLRRLKARLDRAATTETSAGSHEGSRQITQPFDAPDSAALAVYLHGDRRGVEARERMLIQIGLKGTPRRSGTRPAMTIGLVLDLRGEVTPAAAASMQALLKAVAASAELGDRFSLTVAGRPGGTILPPGDLRHGPLSLALSELFDENASGAALDLEQAASAALATVRADDNPNAPLGSSALIVVTAQRLGDLSGRLTAMAHQSAVEGVPWSVVGVGEGVDLAELDDLVLAGQGNRRLLSSAADAASLVDRELAAVSRVVARAVRLRIRLAPGVQLVNVIGSERLGELRSQEVRDAEQSIDQRLSRNLGIQADRGLDEEGIQIVIPSFYAANAHVVLLDVVVPGPGPVADVTVRFKDLVHMKNGVARDHLRVGRAEHADGLLERNVLANLVAIEVAARLDRAGKAVSAGDIEAARTILIDTLDLVRGITVVVEGFAQNPDLEADIEMLEGFVQTLSTLRPNDSARIQATSDSLRYAGRLKILPPPFGDDEPAP